MRSSGVKGDHQELRELRQQPYCLSPLLMIFFSQETTFAGRSHSCNPYKQHALEGAEALHIAKNFHFLLGVFKAFALTGRQANAHKPRALPWARSFCPFRACWVISIILEAVLGFMAFLQPVSDLYPCGRIPQNAAPLLAKTSDGPPTL